MNLRSHQTALRVGGAWTGHYGEAVVPVAVVASLAVVLPVVVEAVVGVMVLVLVPVPAVPEVVSAEEQ